jgi:signal recognition particle receptor subunit beta
MALNKIRSGEVDTPEEVAKAMNVIIGKVNEIEGAIIEPSKPAKTVKKTVKKAAVKATREGYPNA